MALRQQALGVHEQGSWENSQPHSTTTPLEYDMDIEYMDPMYKVMADSLSLNALEEINALEIAREGHDTELAAWQQVDPEISILSDYLTEGKLPDNENIT